jgi:hypothetical protein
MCCVVPTFGDKLKESMYKWEDKVEVEKPFVDTEERIVEEEDDYQ